MNPQRNKYKRFNDRNSQSSLTPTENEFPTRRTWPFLTTVLKSLKQSLEKISKKEKSVSTTTTMKVLNPHDSFLQNWNKVFLLLCVIALAFDPLFFYIPIIDRNSFCLRLDKRLEITACVLRTMIDAFYVIHIVFQFRTGFVPLSSRGFGRGEFINSPKAIAIRYLCSYFVVDVLSILPLPQVVVLAIIPKMNRPASLVTKELLKWVIFCQYAPRITRIFPLFKQVTRISGMVTETAWAGAALNLFLYTLASHVFGAFWYLISIERNDRCWREACEKIPKCIHLNLYCGQSGENNARFLNSTCPLIDSDQITNSTVFNFGIFTDALQSGVVETRDFPKKFFYCFWWGLRNLSALGQSLNTSDFVGEVIFAVIICVSGLVLFALLIGNMQKYLQSTTVRVEEMRVRRTDAEQWMSHRMLPEELRKRIRRYEQYKWQETRGVEEETLLRGLPKDLRRDIKRHLCLKLVKKVPWFQVMDERILDALCDRLKTKLYTKGSYITREGDPVEDMLFIMRGSLTSATTSGGRSGFYNAVHLKAGDFCGDLFTWALDPHSSSNLPISTRTVQAITEVEGFILSADDLKFVSTQYRRLHSKQLRHMFRYYSVQWRTWAACSIQAAWRRHCRRKLLKELLAAEENKLQDTLQIDSDGFKLKLGAALYASKFASNAIQNLRGNSGSFYKYDTMPPLVPQKPTDPKFEPLDET